MTIKYTSVFAGMVALGLLSGVATAATTITVGDAKYGLEYHAAQNATDPTSGYVLARTEALLLPKFTSDVAYAAGDTVTVTIGGTAGAAFLSDGLNTAKLLCSGAGTTDDTDPEVDGAAVADAISTKTQTSATTIAFTLAAGKSCNAGTTMWIKNAKLLNGSLDDAAGSITLSIGATRNGTTIDSTTAPIVVANTVQELNVSIASSSHRLNGIADTRNNSKSFQASAAIDNVADKDELTLTITNQNIVSTTDSAGATDDALVVTITGDWTFLDDDLDGCTTADVSAGDFQVSAATTGAGAGAVPAVELLDCSTLRVTATAARTDLVAAGTNSTLVITVKADGNASGTYTGTGFLRAQTFGGTATLKYTTNGSVAATSRAPSVTFGAFTSRASTVFVPYMPAGVGISQTLYVTNNSSVAGTVTVSGRDQNGVACSSANMGGSIAVGATRVVNLSGAIAAGLANCWGGANVTNKLYLTVSADLPDETLEVYSGFNVGGSDRATVINSSNGRQSAAGQMGAGNSSNQQ